MQLADRRLWTSCDRGEAIAVLREVVALGITHIDTSDFYGPHVTNQIIREALHPTPRICGSSQRSVPAATPRAGGPRARARRAAPTVLENLENLGLDSLDVVNLRVGEWTPGARLNRRGFGALAKCSRRG